MSIAEVQLRISRAIAKYGPFTSTAEGLGVITEEYQELIAAVRSNDLSAVRAEALDVAAAALKLAGDCTNENLRERSK